jgi:hypothetical protein
MENKRKMLKAKLQRLAGLEKSIENLKRILHLNVTTDCFIDSDRVAMVERCLTLNERVSLLGTIDLIDAEMSKMVKTEITVFM